MDGTRQRTSGSRRPEDADVGPGNGRPHKWPPPSGGRLQRFETLELAVDQKGLESGRSFGVGSGIRRFGKLGGEVGCGAEGDSPAQTERGCQAEGWHEEPLGWESGRWVTESSLSWDHLMEWNIRILFASGFRQGHEACGCRRCKDKQLCGKRNSQAREHLEQTSQSPSRCSSWPPLSPREEELGFTLPLKRKVALKPSAQSHVYDPKLPVANRKEAVPINEDEQEEEDTPIPEWLSRLRCRRKRELEARTGGGAARSQGTRRAGGQGRQEQGPRDIQPPGEERRQEGQHERNQQKTVQVRLNLESEGHFEKVIGITGAGGKVADFPQVLLDALSHIPTRVGTACCSMEGKPTTWEGSRVRNLIHLPLSVVYMSRPKAFLDGWFSS